MHFFSSLSWDLIHHVPNRLSIIKCLFYFCSVNLNGCQRIIMDRFWGIWKRPKSFRKRIKSFSKRPRSLRRRWNYADERNSISQESWNNLLSHITGIATSYPWGFRVKVFQTQSPKTGRSETCLIRLETYVKGYTNIRADLCVLTWNHAPPKRQGRFWKR